ncbi:MAG: M15 family metallopeptidase [Pseudomonadales bacterium]|nr:M15 family metallopeptidase [Pseudomonadales bacterium]
MSFNLVEVLKELGITEDFIEASPMPPYEECTDLVDAGLDLFDRPQQMTLRTFEAWYAMKTAAKSDGLELNLVSAYRSIEYQCGLIHRKLEEGWLIDDILLINAIPGYSEHHTGRALDLHAGDGKPLESAFENHPAFAWLCENAAEFNFHLSYPRDNPSGIDYEPWHWCFSSDI